MLAICVNLIKEKIKTQRNREKSEEAEETQIRDLNLKILLLIILKRYMEILQLC